jgi:hypothetical protein
MAKNIKKSQEYLIIIIGIIIILPTIIYLLLSVSEVQTFLVNRISGHLSTKIESTISVGKIEFKFFNRLSVSDILIKDQNKDTLLYVGNVTAGIRKINFKEKSFRFGKVVLIKPAVAIITDSSGMQNLKWYLDLFRNNEDSIKSPPANITINQIDLSGARFSLINYKGKTAKTKMDFNNLNFAGINGIFEDFYMRDDTASMNIYNMFLKEAGGFNIKRFSSSFTFTKQNIMLNSASFICDSSAVSIPKLSMTVDSADSFKNFVNEVKLDIVLEPSKISTIDLKYFIPLKNIISESVWLSGKISGTVSELRGRNIELSYRDYSSLDCDFDLSGLPEIENAFIYIGVNSLKTNAEDIEKIRLRNKGPVIIPEQLRKLGNISFNGSFTGFTTDFVTYGEIITDQGSIRTDISFRPEKNDRYRMKGLITGQELNIGEITGKTELLGKLSMQTNVDGYFRSLKEFSGSLSGQIDSLEINRYLYRNIALNGFFTEKTWDGSVNIDDENIKMDLLGLLNFKDELPEFDFTLNVADANLYKLNFDELDTTASLTMLMTSNFKGNSIDNLDGEIRLLNSTLTKHSENLELYDFSISTYSENNIPVLSLRTDFADADIRGRYNFAEIKSLLNYLLSKLSPSSFTSSLKGNELKRNNFSFEINFKNSDNINKFFRTGLLLSEKSSIKGDVFPDSIISITGNAKMFSLKNNVFNDFSLNVGLTGSELTIDLNSSLLSLLQQTDLKEFAVNLETKPDNFIFKVGWNNKDQNQNLGNFIARGAFAKSEEGPGNGVILTIDIDSTDIFANNNLWKISNSTIIADSNSFKINKFFISNNENYYLIDGAVTEDPADTLHLEFKGIDISPLNNLGKRQVSKDANKIALDINGRLNGDILLTNIYSDLLLVGNIFLNNFSILGSDYGNVTITSNLDINKKLININASNNLDGIKMFDASGYYNPGKKRIDIDADALKLPVGFLNPLLKTFASDIHGLASGRIKFSGVPGALTLRGAIMAEEASLKIDYLQTKYNLNDTIKFNDTGILFDKVGISDEKGNTAILNGIVRHKSFKDFQADIIINTNECLVLNTKPKDNDMFYGTAYSSGVTTIKSRPNSLSFDISANTAPNTKFFIPLNTGLSVSEYSFISFIDADAPIENDSRKNLIQLAPATVKQTGIDLNFDLEITPDAEVQLIFDSKVGDVMKGRGSGNLSINLNKAGDFKMTGDYIIEDGDYLFTLGNILNKSFSVENGGRIVFNGDLDNAEIDIKAIYKLKASLYEVLQDDIYKDRIPVECHLDLSGSLFNPLVGFNIYLPAADEQTRTYLRNAISTEEELSRQFLSLLVMNSFIADPSNTLATQSSGTTGTSAMAVTTTEMLSNQLSNWLSQISNDFDIGFVYRPGFDDINPQEVEVALSTQLLNDKVIINGNFDVRGTGASSANTNQITGDFDAEMKITEKIRFKVFNRFNNPYTGKLVDYTQGIGIFYKQDFNKLSDLFRKRVNGNMKKEEVPAIDE